MISCHRAIPHPWAPKLWCMAANSNSSRPVQRLTLQKSMKIEHLKTVPSAQMGVSESGLDDPHFPQKDAH